MKREFHSRTKAFACLLTMCAGFSDAYTFICRGGTLAAGQTGNVVFLSVGLIGQQISDVEVKLATMLAFMLGIFLMTVLRRLIDNSVWCLSGLYYADFISFYSPTQLCGGGTTKSNSNELPISVPLSFLSLFEA